MHGPTSRSLDRRPRRAHPSTQSELSFTFSISQVDSKRIAELVADGLIELPTDVPRQKLLEVVEHVREHRRCTLTQHIARCIAICISRDHQRGER